MKKIIVVCCAILLSSFNINDSKNQVTNILTSGKWFVESVQELGEEPELSANKNDEWILFHEEGKVEENLYGEITQSKWEYSEEKKSIKITGNEVVYKKIIEISETNLTVEYIEDVNSGDALIINYVK